MKLVIGQLHRILLLSVALATVAPGGGAASAQSLSDALAQPPPAAAISPHSAESRAKSISSKAAIRRTPGHAHHPRHSARVDAANQASTTEIVDIHGHVVKGHTPLVAKRSTIDAAALTVRSLRTPPAKTSLHIVGAPAKPTASTLKPHTLPSLDSMTRDGGAPAATQTSDQGVSIGGAIIRWLLSLILVLALAAAAIAYLRKKGLGVATEADVATGASRSASPPKPMFGMSPLAQMLIRRRPQAEPPEAPNPRFITATSGSTSSIENMQVLATASLPGSNYTLYKIRIDDRILLLGGAPATALNLLTEWDVQTPPQDERKFDAILDQLTNSDPIGVRGSGLLRSAAERLEKTTQRVASLGRVDQNDES